MLRITVAPSTYAYLPPQRRGLALTACLGRRAVEPTRNLLTHAPAGARLRLPHAGAPYRLQLPPTCQHCHRLPPACHKTPATSEGDGDNHGPLRDGDLYLCDAENHFHVYTTATPPPPASDW